jgi:excisionase family DNA binding protein
MEENTSHNLRLLSVSKAAKALGISRSTLNELINSGKIGIIKISIQRKIPFGEIEKFIIEGTTRAYKKSEEPITENKSIPTNIYTEKIFESMWKEFKDGKCIY